MIIICNFQLCSDTYGHTQHLTKLVTTLHIKLQQVMHIHNAYIIVYFNGIANRLAGTLLLAGLRYPSGLRFNIFLCLIIRGTQPRSPYTAGLLVEDGRPIVTAKFQKHQCTNSISSALKKAQISQAYITVKTGGLF